MSVCLCTLECVCSGVIVSCVSCVSCVCSLVHLSLGAETFNLCVVCIVYWVLFVLCLYRVRIVCCIVFVLCWYCVQLSSVLFFGCE